MPLHQEADLVDYDDQPDILDSTNNDGGNDNHGNTSTFEEGSNALVQGTYVGINSAGFRDFFLKAELTRAINDAGFEHPSEVQHEAIPQAICGVDVLCQAKSGMGKTAVFVLSVLNQLKPISEMNLEPGQVYCLGLAHTRELAFQIKNEFDRFCKYMEGIIVMVVYGGTNIKDNIKALENAETSPHIIIGTPGRVNQLSRDKHLKLDKLEIFVVDECDKVLDKLDMRHDVQQIFVRSPKQKQVMMFSATFSPEIRDVCRKFMSKPVEVFVDNESKLTLDGLQQYYVKLTEGEKNRKLSDLLDELEFNQVIVFVKSVQRAKILNQLLVECSFPSISVHGGLPQDKRISLYQSFKNFESRILVSTDLFGRGIDIERVNIVINYDMPDAADTYLHRVGRAGRFGTKGLAISFISSPEDSQILDQVQDRFEVNIPDMPADISTTDYINQ